MREKRCSTIDGVRDPEATRSSVFTPTKPMIAQTASAGHYENAHLPKPFPKVRIFFIKALLSDKKAEEKKTDEKKDEKKADGGV